MDILLPRNIYLLAGNEDDPEQANLYFKNIIDGYKNDMMVKVISDHGRNYHDFWRLESGNQSSRYYDITSGEFKLQIEVFDTNFNAIQQKNIRIEVVPRLSTEICNVLCIGDSMTRAGVYIQHMQEVLPNTNTLGIRTYTDGAVCMEGRGGWTVRQYFTAGSVDGMDSPFMFPSGIEGSKYLGNTVFWKRAIYLDADSYDFMGFQKIAKGWGEPTTSYLFDRDGYPFEKKQGDVIFDPSSDSLSGFLRYNGDAWERMNPQPRWEFSFVKYMERYSKAFVRDGILQCPDIVTILFGANDFQLADGIDVGIEDYLADIQNMIHSIKEYDAQISIIVNMPIMGASQDAWGINMGCQGNSRCYDKNMQEIGRHILECWDNEEEEKKGIYICPMHAMLDYVYGFDMQVEQANKYTHEKVARYNNWVHPNVSGYKQMGDAMAGVIQKIRNWKSDDRNSTMLLLTACQFG